MKYISIQLQPQLELQATKDELAAIISFEGFMPEIVEGEDDGQYVNFNIPSHDLKEDWIKIKNSLLKKTYFMNSTIIVCEGNDGWNDYLLLHHFDKSQILDIL